MPLGRRPRRITMRTPGTRRTLPSKFNFSRMPSAPILLKPGKVESLAGRRLAASRPRTTVQRQNRVGRTTAGIVLKDQIAKLGRLRVGDDPPVKTQPAAGTSGSTCPVDNATARARLTRSATPAGTTTLAIHVIAGSSR